MKKEFIVEREGKSFVLYAGLLDLAHERGLKAITTTLVQIPNDMNGMLAICHATVETEQGTFTGLGDAGPSNVTRLMAPHLIRMAETRAKARALRDAVNVGVTALEELADLDDDPAVAENARRVPDRRGAEGSAVAGSRAAVNGRTPARSPAAANAKGNLRAVDAVKTGDAADPGHESDLDAMGFGSALEGARSGVVEATAGAAGTAGTARVGGPPATPKQIQTIQRMSRAAGKSIDTDGLSRAQASEIISSLIGDMGQLRAS